MNATIPISSGREYYVISTIGPDGRFTVLDVETAPTSRQEADERFEALFVEPYITVSNVYADSEAQAAEILRRDCA
ncbi:hypothetical protein ACH4U6_35135 [Streptomyces netropsis]|uniref:hypothetical protein n=1 Tax=Streptomyces netropsis TaxID=55404 RepID=UPI00378F4975